MIQTLNDTTEDFLEILRFNGYDVEAEKDASIFRE